MVTDIVSRPISEAVQSNIQYPDSDGQPMGESDVHINVMLYLRQALRYFFRQTEQIYVAANLFFYYEEGNPEARRAPDVLVVKGVPKHDRRVYKLWEEKATPCTIFEITSRSTRLEDLGTKRGLYELLGVQEYFLFDPLGEYLSPQLQGFRLVGDYYQPMSLSEDGALVSRELGVTLKPDGQLLRVINTATGEMVPTLDEAIDQTQAMVERAEEEARRAEEEARRAEEEARRAEEEARRAEEEARRAEEEATRANVAEEKAAHLQAELERLRRQLNMD
jgi:Uma2 family endonuclease